MWRFYFLESLQLTCYSTFSWKRAKTITKVLWWVHELQLCHHTRLSFWAKQSKFPLSILEQSHQSLSAFSKETFPLGGDTFLALGSWTSTSSEAQPCVVSESPGLKEAQNCPLSAMRFPSQYSGWEDWVLHFLCRGVRWWGIWGAEWGLRGE